MTADEYRTDPHARANALRLQQRLAGNAGMHLSRYERDVLALAVGVLLSELAAVDMVLYCPKCGTQHLDAPHGEWTNPPHRTHLCQACGHLWRPSDTPTNGVLRTVSGKDADNVPLVQILNATGPVPFPAFTLGPWKMEPAPVGPRGPLSDAQRAPPVAVGRNLSVGTAVSFAAATAYVNGFQDHADITVNVPPVIHPPVG